MRNPRIVVPLIFSQEPVKITINQDFVLPNVFSDPPSELPAGGVFNIVKE